MQTSINPINPINPGLTGFIFAAGLGTRFKPWTDKHPKALAVVNGKSLLQRNVAYLQAHGIRDVLVNVHHFADQIEAAIAAADGWGSRISISDERDAVLETGGGLLKARPLLEGSAFLTLNVDILTDLNLSRLIVDHYTSEALITLAVTDRISTRNLLIDDTGRLTGWQNIATGEKRISIDVSTPKPVAYSGIAVFSPAVFDLIPFTGKFSLIDVYLHLAAAHRIGTFDHSGGRLIDVGKPESVEQAEAMFA